MNRRIAALLLTLALIACNRADPAAEEAAALNNAAEMLDASADDLAAPDDEPAENEASDDAE